MHLWRPGEEHKALPVLNTRCSAVPPRTRRRRRRKAERDRDGPGVPRGTGLFLLISRVSNRGTARGCWQIITLLGAGKGAQRLAVHGDLKTSPFLNRFGKGNSTRIIWIYILTEQFVPGRQANLLLG